MKKTWMVLLFISLVLIPLSAQSERGIVFPASSLQNYTTSPHVDSSGADKTISFWNLPLWIKIAFFVQMAIGIILLLKFAPIIIGKIIKRYKTSNSKTILKDISNNPGTTMSQISKTTGINRETVKYYVMNFIAIGKIRMERVGKFSRLFYASVDYNPTYKVVNKYLNNNTDKQILIAMFENPGETSAELACMFNMNRSSMHWHIKRFLDDEIVMFEQDGMNKRYF